MQLIAIMVNLTRFLPKSNLTLGAVTVIAAACLWGGSGQPARADSKGPGQTIAAGPTTDTPAQGTVQVIFMYDSHCTVSCQQVLPIVRELKKKYGDRVNFTELNTSPDAIKDAKKRAKELGVLSFMADYADYIPIVGVFNAKRKLCKDLVGPKTRDIYEAAIQKVLTEYKPADSK